MGVLETVYNLQNNHAKLGAAMPSHSETRLLPYRQDELFDIVADVKDYPSFIPWCKGARVRGSKLNMTIADLDIGFGPFKESFTSHVELDRPRQVVVRAIEGPLEHLNNKWTFTPVNDATLIDFAIDFRFKSHLLDHVAETMFHETTTRMMAAFEARARTLYSGKSPATSRI